MTTPDPIRIGVSLSLSEGPRVALGRESQRLRWSSHNGARAQRRGGDSSIAKAASQLHTRLSFAEVIQRSGFQSVAVD
jgi:hypothetical protein